MKLLFIACYSPIINNSAAIETLMYLNSLAKIKNNKVHLLTVDFPENSIYYDEKVLKMLDKNVIIHKISGGIIFNKIMPKKSNTNETCDGSEKNTNINSNSKMNLLRKIKNRFIFPDMYLMWSFKAAKYGINLMKKEKFDVIFSMHEPPSSHIMAKKIKSKFMNIPWIAYWSDPWLKDPSRENIGCFRKIIEGKMEKSVACLADKHIFVTYENRDEFIKSYGIKKENTYIITRGYDKNTYDEVRKLKKPNLLKENKFNLVYAGEIMSKIRDVNPFIEAVNKLKNNNEEFFNKLNILFFGNIDDENIKQKLMNVENIKVNSRIDYKLALSYMIHSDGLLLFGNKNSKQIPAKIYDYFGTDNQVLVILGDENDPIKRVANNKSKCLVTLNNSSSIEKSLESMVKEFNEGKKFHRLEEFEWGYIGEKLNSILTNEIKY